MRTYLSLMKIKFFAEIQYRVAAVAGILTQLFFGMMYIFMYESYYEAGSPFDMTLSQLVSYLWLGQAFLCLIYNFVETDIYDSIRTGQVAYELVRPFSIYWYWFSKILASKATKTFLRFWPVLLISILLPRQYAFGAPVSWNAFLLFVVTLILGVILSISINMFIYMMLFYTVSSKGIFNSYCVISNFFSGHWIPITFMPKVLQTISYILPFRLAVDLPFRLYVGAISIDEGIKEMHIQIIWIVLTIFLGNVLMKKFSKKLVIQGG